MQQFNFKYTAMDNTEDNKVKKYVPNDHLANERTLLAWIRTAIAIMAFGFVVVKFSLFMQQLAFLMTGKKVEVAQNTFSAIAGIIIVITGAVTLIISFVQYKITEKRLLENTYRSASKMVLLLVVLLLIVSVFITWYLIDRV